jgi:hypothetical protein
MNRFLKKIFKKDDNFGIIISESDDFSFEDIQENHVVLKLEIDSMLKPKPLLTQADPFLFVRNGILYVFYESDRSGEKGIIRMTMTKNLKDWSKPITVLDEPFHLSFPFIFEKNNDVYMIPESQISNAIRLYKGNDDLTAFSFVKTLMDNQRVDDIKFNYCDSHLLNKDNTYYLFTSISYKWTYHLELYYTDDPIHHKFIKHPQSPIYVGNDFGRSGGSIICHKNEYYRISQNCSQHYGGNLSVHQITKIDKEHYSEKLLHKDLLKTGGNIYRDGGHQLNITKFCDKFIYATDFRHFDWSWYQLFLRLKTTFCIR